MIADSRLNLLLTHIASGIGSDPYDQPHHQPWYQSLSALLAPMGVRTFEATSGPEAMEVIEKNPIHLAVVDSRLHGTDQLSLPKLIQKIREKTPSLKTQATAINVKVRFGDQPDPGKFEIRVEAQQCELPTVILLTPARNDQMLAEALKFNVFSVVPEPVDLNLMLDIMARALRRYHQNHWPQ